MTFDLVFFVHLHHLKSWDAKVPRLLLNIEYGEVDSYVVIFFLGEGTILLDLKLTNSRKNANKDTVKLFFFSFLF